MSLLAPVERTWPAFHTPPASASFVRAMWLLSASFMLYVCSVVPPGWCSMSDHTISEHGATPDPHQFAFLLNSACMARSNRSCFPIQVVCSTQYQQLAISTSPCATVGTFGCPLSHYCARVTVYVIFPASTTFAVMRCECITACWLCNSERGLSCQVM